MFKVSRTAGNILKPQYDSNVHIWAQISGGKEPHFFATNLWQRFY